MTFSHFMFQCNFSAKKMRAHQQWDALSQWMNKIDIHGMSTPKDLVIKNNLDFEMIFLAQGHEESLHSLE